MQSPASGIYVDLRLPKDSPGRSLEKARALGIQPCPGALAATKGSLVLPAGVRESDILPVLCRQKSFAGVLDYKRGDATDSGLALSRDVALASLAKAAEADGRCLPLCTCFWRRDLDYQPPTGGLDVGVCASEPPREEDGSLLLRETGEDASYAEGWLRLAGSEAGPFMALELVSENGKGGARKGYWVRAGRWFAYAVGRPITAESAVALGCAEKSDELAHCVGKTLLEAVTTTLKHANVLDLVASYVGVAGEVDGRGKWRIQHSTNPSLVGCLLMGPADEANCCSCVEGEFAPCNVVEQTIVGLDDGSPSVQRSWKVIELEAGYGS
jgi:hypothetical protein